MYQCGNEVVKSRMVTFASMKLCRGETESEMARMAALGIRVILEYDTARESSRAFEDKLVESYLRIVFAVPSHREFMRTGSPSEPLLVEAAGWFLDPGLTDQLLVDAPRMLSKAFEKGLLAKGERGEMVVRLFWIAAHDVAINNTLGRKPSGPLNAADLRRGGQSGETRK